MVKAAKRKGSKERMVKRKEKDQRIAHNTIAEAFKT